MKKLWTTSQDVRRNRIHAEQSLARRKKWKEWKRNDSKSKRFSNSQRQLVSSLGSPRRRPPISFPAPTVLSLVDAPAETLHFFARMIAHKQNRDLFVDLSRVQVITPDAIAFLLAVVRSTRPYRVKIGGNYPNTPSAKDLIRESGFNDYLKTSMSSSGRPRGAIVRQDLSIDSKSADGRFAKQLIDFAADGADQGHLRLKGTYGHLLECMGNTHQHAGKVEGDTTWWASAFRDAARKCDCFTFIDMGIGIFNSVELSARLRLFKLTGLLRPIILKELLEGKIPSSTGKAYRGRGLPSIYKSAQADHLQRFVILTNEVYADTKKNDFRSMSADLRGVVLYWEVRHE